MDKQTETEGVLNQQLMITKAKKWKRSNIAVKTAGKFHLPKNQNIFKKINQRCQ